MSTDAKEYPSTEEPLIHVPQICLFALPEETREVFRANWNGVVSDPFTGAAKKSRRRGGFAIAGNHKICLREVIPVMLRWAQEPSTSIVHETPTTFIGGDLVTGWPQ